MTELRLARLPERTPIKLTIHLTPQLHADLTRYAALYTETYGREEAVHDLIPSMLGAFLESDRAFTRARSGGK